MVDNLKKLPQRGILKNSSSFDVEERHGDSHKETKWDEMNIIATHHPADKDYGHMKIDEPKTPYAYNKEDSGDEVDGVNPDALCQRILEKGNEERVEQEEESDEERDETPEERAKRKAFETKRKHHYNEFAAVKLARKLMEQDDEEDGEETPENGSNRCQETQDDVDLG